VADVPDAVVSFSSQRRSAARRCGTRLASTSSRGVVAKRLRQPYLCRERRWVKVKNRAYWRYELEREGAIKVRQRATI
jgi:ATP-dependent DNA ligase